MELIIILIFASIVALGLALANVGQRPEQRRLARLAGGEAAGDGGDEGGVLTKSEVGFLERMMRPLVGEGSLTQERIGPVRKRLVHAGYRRDSAVVIYMGSRIALALALPVLFLTVPVAWSLDQLQLLMGLVASMGAGLVLPSSLLDRQVKARQRAIELALPDALDLMVVCVEAGLGINASLKRIADDFRVAHPILAEEFALANFETRAGKSTTEALRGLADRTGVGDVSSLVAMLIQTERFGTGVADTLRVHADAMRLRRLQRAEEQANKAPLKMLFPTVLIFVAMLIIVVGPGFMALSNYFGGR